MNRTFDRVIDIAAYVVGTIWDLADQAREYIPSILAMLATLAGTLASILASLATLATALASCIALGYTALKPICVAQGKAGARALVRGGRLIKATAPLLLNRLYEALRALPQKGMLVSKFVSKSMSKLGASWMRAWQFRKECLA